MKISEEIGIPANEAVKTINDLIVETALNNAEAEIIHRNVQTLFSIRTLIENEYS